VLVSLPLTIDPVSRYATVCDAWPVRRQTYCAIPLLNSPLHYHSISIPNYTPPPFHTTTFNLLFPHPNRYTLFFHLSRPHFIPPQAPCQKLIWSLRNAVSPPTGPVEARPGMFFVLNIDKNSKSVECLTKISRDQYIHQFIVTRRRREMYIGHARLCVCVCLSLAACPHYCTDPDVTCGMVGVPCSCALLGGFAIGAWVSLL